MLKQLLILFCITGASFAQIQYGGSPKYFDLRVDNLNFIEIDKTQEVDREFHPMVFQFGNEYNVDINVLELSQQLPSLPTQGAERVAAASLEYPIIVVKSDGQYRYVLDGNHRLQRAIDEEVESIKAKILDVSAEAKTPERSKRTFG